MMRTFEFCRNIHLYGDETATLYDKFGNALYEVNLLTGEGVERAMERALEGVLQWLKEEQGLTNIRVQHKIKGAYIIIVTD
jgi:hypothetical protein